MKINYSTGLIFLLSICAMLGACQSNKSTVGGFFDLDTDLKIEFVVDADINPDGQGSASPLFVRMYQLKSEKMMNNADFIDLYEQDGKTLGADMIGEVRKLKPFKPGENRTEIFVLDANAQYVAFYGEFQDFEDLKF